MKSNENFTFSDTNLQCIPPMCLWCYKHRIVHSDVELRTFNVNNLYIIKMVYILTMQIQTCI